MSALLDERFIAVNPSLIRAIGLTKAVVLQEIHFASREDYIGGPLGQVTMGQDELAGRIGLSRDVTHRALKDLLAEGLIWIEQSAPTAKKSYRVNRDRVAEACADPRKILRGSAQAEAAIPSSIEEGEEENPPTPLASKGGDAGSEPELFARSPKGAHRRRKARASAEANSMVVAGFESWWDDWPSGKGRGQRATTLDAWCKRLKAGTDRHGNPLTMHDLRVRQGHYRAARASYHRFWQDRGVEAHAPMLNGSTFVNSKSHLWAEEWDDDDLRYWPPPRGYSWDDPAADHGAVIGSGMFDALDAEIEATREAG